jgi:hypothetical protein
MMLPKTSNTGREGRMSEDMDYVRCYICGGRLGTGRVWTLDGPAHPACADPPPHERREAAPDSARSRDAEAG